jgi:Flp pilus assembly protein TadD
VDLPVNASPAILAPLAGAAVLRSGAGWAWVSADGAARPAADWEVRHLLSTNADALLQVATVEPAEVARELTAAIADQRALAMWLILLDDSASRDLRRRAAAHLRGLLAEPPRREAMRRRVLSRPAPAGLHLALARDIAVEAGSQAAVDLLDQINLHHGAVWAVSEATAARLAEATLAERAELHGVLTDDATAATLVEAVASADRARAGRAVVRLSAAHRHLPRLPRAAQDIVQRARADLGRKAAPAPVEAMVSAPLASESTPAAALRYRSSVPRARQAIREALEAGEHTRAATFADELVAAQVTNEGHGRFACKTLCDLAAAAEASAPELAEAWLRRAHELLPTDPFPVTQLVTLLRRQGRTKEALGVAQRGAADFPSHSPLLCTTAELLRQLGRFDEAAARFRQVQASDPNHVAAWSGFAELCRHRGDLDAAERAFRHAQMLAPANVYAWSGFAELCRHRGDLNAAEEAYRHAQSLDPRDIVAWTGFAELCRHRGDLDAAHETYRHAQALEPRNVVAWNGFAELCRQRGDLDAAHDAYRHAQALDPRDVVTWNGFAELCRQRGDLHAAHDAYRHAQALDPRNGYAWNGFAELCRHSGDLDAAERAYRHVQAFDPRDVVTWNGFAELCRQRGDLHAAHDAYRHAQSLDPRNIVTWTGFGGLQLQRRDWPAAEAAFRAAIDLAPHDGVACTGLAIALVRQRRWPEALAAVPAPAIARTLDDWQVLRWRGILLAWQGQTEEALALLRRGSEAPWPAVRAQFAASIAAVALRRGDPAGAEHALQSAPATDPTGAALTALLLCHALILRRRPAEAAAQLPSAPSLHAAQLPLRDTLHAWALAPANDRTEEAWSAELMALAA